MNEGLTITMNTWPPSTNSLWRAVNGRNILSKAARAWYTHALLLVSWRKLPDTPMLGKVEVTLKFMSPTHRGYDVDNRAKAVLDLLVKAGVIRDDSQVEILHLHKRGVVSGGLVEIHIQPIDGQKQQSENTNQGRAA